MNLLKFAWPIAFIFSVFQANVAHASDSTAGYINQIFIMDNGVVLFSQTGTRTTPPSCQTVNRWAFDASTPSGQNYLAFLLTAHAANSKILIHGTSSCSVRSDSETISWIKSDD